MDGVRGWGTIREAHGWSKGWGTIREAHGWSKRVGYYLRSLWME